MKYFNFLICLLFLSSCAPKKTYDDSELDQVSKKNTVIQPYGTYESEGLIGSFNIPILYIDSNSLKLTFMDSTEKEISVIGKWTKQSFDTQHFSYPAPFNEAIFASDGIYFIDSIKRYFFHKTSDSIISITVQDSLNIKP